MPVKLNAAAGGSVTLDPPATASNFTATFPANTGTVITTASTGAVTQAMLAQPLTLTAPQNSTSGTAIDFTAIPSWVRRITVMFNGVSTNGTSIPIVQIGAGSAQTTGYTGSFSLIVPSAAVSGSNLSSGFPLGAASAASVRNGSVVLSNFSGTAWVCQGAIGFSDGAGNALLAGYVALSGTLDRVRITTVNGTDTFDAGSINVMYEG